MYALMRESGATALHSAVIRGDAEVVEILLSYGANPLVTNNSGDSSITIGGAFPELQGIMEKRAIVMVWDF